MSKLGECLRRLSQCSRSLLYAFIKATLLNLLTFVAMLVDTCGCWTLLAGRWRLSMLDNVCVQVTPPGI